jgi:potassium/chloride transporter 9
MTGASRILQAIARDDLVPGLGIFAYGTKRGDEPIVALLFTFVIVGVWMWNS